MLRRSVRSMGSNYCRLWELASKRCFTSSCIGTNVVLCDSKNAPRVESGIDPCTTRNLNRQEQHSKRISSEELRNNCPQVEFFKDQGLKSTISSTYENSNHYTQRRSSIGINYYSRWAGLNSSAAARSLCLTPTGATRCASTEVTSQEESGAEKAKSQPRSIEDFQHEEIVGPTVERDVSDTADELRESLSTMRKFMTSLSTGFVILGSVQLVAAVWASWSKLDPLHIDLWRDLPYVAMSYTFAYLLWNAGSAIDFFSKLEERSRIRVLTLSLQVIKGMSQFLGRSNVMVKFVTFTSLFAFIGESFIFK